MTTGSTALVAATCAAAAALLLLRGGRVPLRTEATAAGRRAALAGAGATSLVIAFSVLDGADLALVLIGAAVVIAAGRELRRRHRVAEAEQRADQVLATCDALAADLRAGQPPVSALAAAAADWPQLGSVAAAAELGADVPAALRALARHPGAGQLRVVAAAWQVGHSTGAGLASALAMASERLRDDRATARVVATEMAAATATARMLAALPVAVILLGNGLGGDPLGFLLRSAPGMVCLVLGLALEYAGLVWLARIADHVAGRRVR